MSKRQEFKEAIKDEIRARATDPAGILRCEECGCAIKGRNYHVDHIVADGLRTDEHKRTHKLTAADGQLLCAGSKEACHTVKTGRQDIPAIAKAKRTKAKNKGPVRPPQRKIHSRGFPKVEKPPKRPTKIARGATEIARLFSPPSQDKGKC